MLCVVAQEQGFDGSILLALYNVRMDATYKSDCSDRDPSWRNADQAQKSVGGPLWMMTATFLSFFLSLSISLSIDPRNVCVA